VNMNLELISLYAKDDKVKPVVDRAKGAARRGAKLTGQLLSFARSQSLHPKLTHVNKLLLGMRDLIEISAGSGIVVEFELCEQDCPVVLDPSQLEMAVLNLAVNSRDAMPEGGTLRITASCVRLGPGQELKLSAGDYIRLSVADTGAGMDERTCERAIEPFFSTKGPTVGTGLGLSISYGIVRRHGGRILVDSAVGQGTTFRVQLPLRADAA